MSDIQEFQNAGNPLCEAVTPEQEAQLRNAFTELGITPLLRSQNHNLQIVARRCVAKLYPALIPPSHVSVDRLVHRLIAAKYFNESTKEETEHILVREAMDMFFVTSRPERYDLFNHLSSADHFFIDGDSLVMDALCNVNVCWEAVQPLHVAYLVERLLLDLLNRGARFTLIFFDCLNALWSADHQKHLVRTLLKLRLEQRASDNGFSFVTLPDWWGPKMEALIKERRPDYFFLSDAEQIDAETVAEQAALAGNPSATENHGLLAFPSARLVMQSLTLWAISKALHVAYSSRIAYKDNGMLVFVLRSVSDRFVPARTLMPHLKMIVDKTLAPVLADIAAAPLGVELGDTIDATFDAADAAKISFQNRDIAIAVALKALVAASPRALNFAKLIVLTHVVIKTVPLSSRAQTGIVAIPPAIREELDRFAEVASRVLPALITELENNDPNLVDLVDGRLLVRILDAARDTKELDPTALLGDASLNMYDTLTGIITKDDSNIVVPASWIPPPLVDETLAVAKLAAVPHTPLLHMLLGITNDDLAPNVCDASLSWTDARRVEVGEANDRRLNDLQTGQRIPRDLSLAPLDDPAGYDEYERKEREYAGMTEREKKRHSKKLQQFVSSVQQTAESMDIQAFLSQRERLMAGSGAVAAAPAQKVSAAAEKLRRENIVRKAKEEAESLFDQLRNMIDRTFADTTKTRTANGISTMEKFIASATIDIVQKDSSVDKALTSDKQLEAWRGMVGTADESEFTVPANPYVPKVKPGGKLDLAKALATVQKFSAEFAKSQPKKTLLNDPVEAEAILQIIFFKFFVAHLKNIAYLRAMSIARDAWAVDVEQARLANAEVSSFDNGIELFRRINSLLDYQNGAKIRVSNASRIAWRQALATLAFEKPYVAMVEREEEAAQGRPCVGVPALDANLIPRLSHTATQFQMTAMGHLLPRPRSGLSDKRVPFRPDPWQLELLDIVDKGRSAVVCIPTSGGKTFISYYCMKKVLQMDDESVSVYVAPTRSLLNQAMADAYGRFNEKTFASNNGMQVWGCLGGDGFIHVPFKCQILITLPETLENLLLSPQKKHRDWCKRIKYVVFDEVHSVENSANGDVWERLLSLMRCPFVALSATLGSTVEVHAWLNRTQSELQSQLRKQLSRPGIGPNERADLESRLINLSEGEQYVELIPRGNVKVGRWSDIEKHMFLPTDLQPFVRDIKRGEPRNLLPVHPMTIVTRSMMQTKFPQDLAFTPKETFQFHHQMSQVFDDIISPLGDDDAHSALVQERRNRLNELDPDVFFKNERQVTQARCRELEALLKAEAIQWGEMSRSHTVKDVRETFLAAVDELLLQFRSDVSTREASVVASASVPGSSVPHPDTSQFVQNSIVPLLCTLNQRKMLPAIIFSLDEEGCNSLVEKIVDDLEAAEAAYRATPEFKEWAKIQEAKQADLEKRRKYAQSGGNRVKEKDDKGDVVVRIDESVSIDDGEDYTIPEVLPEFSFAPKMNLVSGEDLQDINDALYDNPLMKRALARGIGLHHNGIRGKIRIYVERLFRLRQLPIIVASETLALGIHSPCRTVVFGGDSITLNPINYRQMAGRSARRGLDFIGHAVFVGVPLSKVQRLLTSDLTSLQGHLLLDPTTELRLALNVAEVGKEESERSLVPAIAPLFVEPLWIQARKESPAMRLSSLIHTRASLALFIKQAFITVDNEPTILGSMLIRVLNSFKEVRTGRGAFALVSLLESGALTQMANVLAESPDELRKQLCDVVSYLFTSDHMSATPLELHRSVLRDPNVFGPHLENCGEHMVVLPPIRRVCGGHLKTIIDKLTVAALAHYSTGLGAVSKTLPPAKTSLPLSKPRAPPAASADPIALQLASTAANINVRSPFVAISGANDTFTGVEDMCRSLRDGLFLDPYQFPVCDYRDAGRHDRGQVLINACIHDFMHTGHQFVNEKPRRDKLALFNGLSEQKSYYAIEGVLTVLENLVAFFKRCGNGTPEEPHPIFTEAFDQLRGKVLAEAIRGKFRN